MRENIIEAQIDYSPRRDTWEVYDFDWIRMGAWGEVAKIKALDELVRDNNIIITKAKRSGISTLYYIYLIIDETHPLFNFPILREAIDTELDPDLDITLVDGLFGKLCDILEKTITQYNIDIKKEVTSLQYDAE